MGVWSGIFNFESEKISIIFFGIGLLFVMLFFIVPIGYSSYWLVYSYGLIIQITPYATTFHFILFSFVHLPFSLAIFIACLVSIRFCVIIVRKKKESENYYKLMRKMAFVIGSSAAGFVLLMFFFGQTILQLGLFIMNPSYLSMDIWILTWVFLTSLVVYFIIGIVFASKSTTKIKFRFTWIICGYFVPIPLLTLMYYSGFTLALYLPFIGVTFIFLEHLISNRIRSKPELKNVNRNLPERALQRSKIIIYLLIGLVIILGIVIGFLIMRLVWYNTVCPYVGEIFY